MYCEHPQSPVRGAPLLKAAQLCVHGLDTSSPRNCRTHYLSLTIWIFGFSYHFSEDDLSTWVGFLQ